MSSSIISDATMKFGLETAPILSQGNADGKLGDKLKGDAYEDNKRVSEDFLKAEVYFKEMFGIANVFVDDNPRISTFGVSTCYFYLMCGTFEESQFCYLNHNVDRYEKTTISKALYFILNDIVVAPEKNFYNESVNIIDSLNDVYLFVGGGGILTQDVVREACLLLRNADERTVTKLKREFDDIKIINLFDKLFNRIIILKAISVVLSDKEESEASSKLFLNKI